MLCNRVRLLIVGYTLFTVLANASSTLYLVSASAAVSDPLAGYYSAAVPEFRFLRLQQSAARGDVKLAEATPTGFIGALLLLFVYHASRSRV